jgi:hypothetical protein
VRARAWPIIGRLEALARAAEPVRWLGGVRLDRDAAYDLLDELRMVLPEDISEQRR